MKNLIAFTAFVLLFAELANAQEKILITDINATVYSPQFLKSRNILNDFLKTQKVRVIRLEESETDMVSEFYIGINKEKELNELIENLGFIQSKEIETNSYDEKIEKINLEIDYLKQRKTAYENEINNMEAKDERYYNYWEEIRHVEKKIYELNDDLKTYRDKSVYKVSISLYDDSVDLTDRDINWVNMPGGSFDMLWVETPKNDLSASMYMGYSLKYMITRGKTHFTLGALKEYPKDEEADPMRYTELFHFGFGQDFYTKHFGRGKRKWFNLYTGYNAGGIFATGTNDKSMLPYVNAYLGVELFKNQYFLIDNKAGYFVPFRYNRNLRGWMYHASFNFVF